jgi:hypothetical protein
LGKLQAWREQFWKIVLLKIKMADKQSNQGKSQEITPEMVQQVAEKVYQMLLLEMSVAHDRQRPGKSKVQYQKRGR